jgi:hypothetical protein
LKSQNEYKNNLNNLRDLALLGDITESMQFPLAFTYELFKSSALGLQISFRAKIEWVPSSGTIIYQLIYQRGSQINEYEPKKNYNR